MTTSNADSSRYIRKDNLADKCIADASSSASECSSLSHASGVISKEEKRPLHGIPFSKNLKGETNRILKNNSEGNNSPLPIKDTVNYDKGAGSEPLQRSMETSDGKAGIYHMKSTSEEEIALHGIIEHIHSFSFDKAKDQAEKERDASRSSGSSMWQTFLGCMVQFVIAEKLYMNMSFLAGKGFLRKE
ncbi:hypothetical protein SK128_022127, partial [Halocaridina rubra]